MKTNVKRTVKSGALSIAVKEFADGRYGFDYKPPGGIRVKVRLNDIDEAERRAKKALGTTHAAKLDLLAIDPDEFAEFLAWKAARRPEATVAELTARFLASKAGKGRSEWHIRDLKGSLKKFGERFQTTISKLSREDVEAWLNSFENIGPRRWNNLLAPVLALHRFARREGVLGADIMPVERIEKRKAVTRIETYTVEELKKLLAAVPEEWLPVVVLGAFEGCRPEEVCPGPYTEKPGLRWENFLWEKGKIDMPKEVSKVRRRRFIPLTDAAIAFLIGWRGKKGEVAPRKPLANHSRNWSRDSGVKWKNDGLRHSFASYRLAMVKDIAALALEMGNSPSVIFNSYLDLKHEDDAERWFALRP